MNDFLFTIRDLDVAPRGQRILNVPVLNIPYGHTAVIGPNGAGKSTLLRALLGRCGGTISCGGLPAQIAVKQRHIAWVGQHGQFNIPLKVAEYVQLGTVHERNRWFISTVRRLPEKVQTLLAAFDLAHLSERRIGSLSGGEQQRANIVRAILQDAPLLLLDEPLNHLDIRHRYALMDYLREKHQDFSVVMVLHDLEIAANYADHIVLMHQGAVAASGSPQDVMTDERLSEIYQWQIHSRYDNDRKIFLMGSTPKKL